MSDDTDLVRLLKDEAKLAERPEGRLVMLVAAKEIGRLRVEESILRKLAAELVYLAALVEDV